MLFYCVTVTHSWYNNIMSITILVRHEKHINRFTTQTLLSLLLLPNTDHFKQVQDTHSLSISQYIAHNIPIGLSISALRKLIYPFLKYKANMLINKRYVNIQDDSFLKLLAQFLNLRYSLILLRKRVYELSQCWNR
jgi:hypothetical protein